LESAAFEQQVIAIGSSVYAADGEVVGQVKAVRGSYFQIDVEGAPDYWLSASSVANSETSSVHLRYPSEVISRMAVPAPAER